MKISFKISNAALVRLLPAALALGAPGWWGCANSPAAGLTTVAEDPSDRPLRTATPGELERFADGDVAFDVVYLEPDGLGPNYVRNSCAACHKNDSKGPGGVEKMAVVEADGVTLSADQSPLRWGHSVRPYYGGGASTPLAPPQGVAGLKMSLRVGVAVFGRGYIEAVDDAEIVRLEMEQAARSDGIHGRINRVAFASMDNPERRFHQHHHGDTGLIGRFGVKARVATLDDFAADAAQGDMSITSPMRPDELANPDGRTDDAKAGVDIDIEVVNQLADYVRMLEIPRRAEPAAGAISLFEATLCAACHVPSLHTRADYPIQGLAGIAAPIFSDLLLHDMGAELADGLVDGQAGSRQWRSAPLIGLRHLRSYLHDGRAKTIEQAILAHDGSGSQAHVSVERFRALSAADRQALITYVESL